MRFTSTFVLTLTAVCSGATAQTVTGLYNTGVDASGTPLANQTTDSAWTSTQIGGPPNYINDTALTSANGYPASGPWLDDDSLSDWIIDPRAQNVVGETIYQTSFTLSGDVSDFSLLGQLSVDNEVDNFIVNGSSIGGAASGFSTWTNFDLGSGDGWKDGTNTVQFIVKNDGGPTGFRVEFADATTPSAAPDGPISCLLVSAVVGAMLLVRRRIEQNA